MGETAFLGYEPAFVGGVFSGVMITSVISSDIAAMALTTRDGETALM